MLFADVVGFTTMAERLDPEALREFQNALFEEFAASIDHFGGFVEKFIGDAVLAVFGAPVAHEDDPERALGAALDLMDRTSRLGGRWSGRLGRKLDLHIGVHTGAVVAGSFGKAAGAAYAVTGDTVNTTARLLAAASGLILVSEATYELTRHRFSFELPQQLELRGRSEPVIVRRLVGKSAEPSSARGLATHGMSAPLIGRGKELGELLEAFDEMKRGRAQIMDVIGEAGTGKSRLVREFLDRVAVQDRLGAIVIRRISCSSLGEPPYRIFASLFREAYEVSPDETLDVARQKLFRGLQSLGTKPEVADTIAPALRFMLGIDATQLPELDPEQLRRQISLASRTLFKRRLENGPLLVIVDDFHNADAASIDLLRDVADHLVDQPLMILLCYRPTAHPPTFAKATQRSFRLAPLSSDDSRMMVSRLFGSVSGNAFDQVQGYIAARSGGNPLFVEEIVRSLVASNVIRREGERWICPATCDNAIVPATLHGLLLSRFDALATSQRRLLQVAAVLGEQFDGPLLLSIAADGHKAPSVLAELVAADLVREPRPGRDGDLYCFTHALIHEVVYLNSPAIPPYRSARTRRPGARGIDRHAAEATQRSGGARTSLEPERQQAQRRGLSAGCR